MTITMDGRQHAPIVQNPGKPSRWRELARNGHQGAQFKDVQPKYPIKVSELLEDFPTAILSASHQGQLSNRSSFMRNRLWRGPATLLRAMSWVQILCSEPMAI